MCKRLLVFCILGLERGVFCPGPCSLPGQQRVCCSLGSHGPQCDLRSIWVTTLTGTGLSSGHKLRPGFSFLLCPISSGCGPWAWLPETSSSFLPARHGVGGCSLSLFQCLASCSPGSKEVWTFLGSVYAFIFLIFPSYIFCHYYILELGWAGGSHTNLRCNF